LVIFAAFTADAQQMLVFRKSKSKIAYYEKGEVISFRLHGDRTRHTFQIENFSDSAIVFGSREVALKEISHIYVDQKTREWFFLRYKYEKLFLIAGFGYMMLDVINTGELTEETKWVSVSLISAGVLAHLLVNDKFRIAGRKRLYLIDI
jgi:hypothetical protein